MFLGTVFVYWCWQILPVQQPDPLPADVSLLLAGTLAGLHLVCNRGPGARAGRTWLALRPGESGMEKCEEKI